MTVWKPKDCVAYRYDFWLFGERHSGSAFVTSRSDAETFESNLKQKLRRRRAGLEAADASDTPRCTDWAAITYQHAVKRKKLKRPEQFKTNLQMILRFWGPKPRKAPVAGAPYHDLRLGDPIADPEWLEKFESWMDDLKISGSRKNAYRSACSSLYRVALLPTHRKRSQVRENPFERGIRDRVPKRIRTFTHEQLRAVITEAAWHIRIALSIGALAPKFRLRNVLDLQWSEHVSADLSRIEDPDHKTDQETGLPLVVNVSSELKAVLEIAKTHRRGRYVVHYRGKHVDDIKTGLKRAVGAAAIALKDPTLVWGRTKGVTFHSLRHTMATELTRMGITPLLRDRLMGWSDPSTGRIYTHLVAADEVEPLERLGERMPVADVVGAPKGKTVGLRKTAAQSPSKARPR